eukprot:TRINITY_DN10960_c0_g1_i5.p1 TRINITY_DN10960_c0_g1~~TRINITY_DN10960_c0_g1_i5.p1  ORF type:complete len:281 (+),score=49.25 TRINITY_DN10960_c0_g1_i5:744-1586(+)
MLGCTGCSSFPAQVRTEVVTTQQFGESGRNGESTRLSDWPFPDGSKDWSFSKTPNTSFTKTPTAQSPARSPAPSRALPAREPVEETTDNPTQIEPQNSVTHLHQLKLSGRSRLVSITWCKGYAGSGFLIKIEGDDALHSCKVDVRHWIFWKRHGSKSFDVDGTPVMVHWDCSSAKYGPGAPEPQEHFFVALVCNDEVILQVGDMGKEVYRQTGARPALKLAQQVMKRQQLHGRREEGVAIRTQFVPEGKSYDVEITCDGKTPKESSLVITVDGKRKVGMT